MDRGGRRIREGEGTGGVRGEGREEGVGAAAGFPDASSRPTVSMKMSHGPASEPACEPATTENRCCRPEGPS